MRKIQISQENIKSMRCCGNCSRNDGIDCVCDRPHSVCDYWMFDNMSYEERENIIQNIWVNKIEKYINEAKNGL